MRCPTQAAPMPPAQAEALCDLGLEERHQEPAEADALSAASEADAVGAAKRYDDSLIRRAQRSLAASHALPQGSPEKHAATPSPRASVYPPS